LILLKPFARARSEYRFLGSVAIVQRALAQSFVRQSWERGKIKGQALDGGGQQRAMINLAHAPRESEFLMEKVKRASPQIPGRAQNRVGIGFVLCIAFGVFGNLLFPRGGGPPMLRRFLKRGLQKIAGAPLETTQL